MSEVHIQQSTSHPPLVLVVRSFRSRFQNAGSRGGRHYALLWGRSRPGLPQHWAGLWSEARPTTLGAQILIVEQIEART